MNNLQNAIQDYFEPWTNLFQFAVEIGSITSEEEVEKNQNLQKEVDNLTFIAARDPDWVERYLQEFQTIQAQTDTALAELQPQIASVNNLLTIRTAMNKHFRNPWIGVNFGDFNNDGHIDGLTYQRGTGYAAIHSSIDIGTPTQLFSSTGQGVAGYNLLSGNDQIVVFDYDGDQDDDLFLYRPGRGAAWVASSNGDGSFTPVYAVGDNGWDPPNGITGYNLMSEADRVLPFDYDGDGDDDLFLFRPGRGAAWVASSNGDGSFTSVYAVGDNGWDPPNGIAGYNLMSTDDKALVFDYNGDGKEDLLLYRPGRGAAWIAHSNGDGSFSPVHAVGDNGWDPPNGIAGYNMMSRDDIAIALDYDGDGDDDLFLYRPGRGTAWVARSEGDGSFTSIYAVGDNGSDAPNGIVGYNFLSAYDRAFSFDYNEDGLDDLIFYQWPQSLLCVAQSNGDGTFTKVDIDLADLPSTLQNQTAEIIESAQTRIDEVRDRHFPSHTPSNDCDNQHIQGDGTFGNPIYAHDKFAGASGWSNQEQYALRLRDVNGDRLADIVGFGHLGVHVALANGDGTFGSAIYAHNQFSVASGWTNQDQYPRLLADVNGDRSTDIVGFFDSEVRVALANGDGTFGNIIHARNDFSAANGWTRSLGENPRWVVDVNDDRVADIVGFSDSGVRVALGNGDGTFSTLISAHNDFSVEKGWSNQRQYPRFLTDINGDGLRDIVGFGHTGVRVALGNGDGTFGAIIHAHNDFSVTSGWINQGQYPRRLTDVNRDGLVDILGFGPSGVRVALANGDGTFGVATHAPNNSFVTSGTGELGQFPRALGNLNGDGLSDLVRFTDTGVYAALANHISSDAEACPPIIDPPIIDPRPGSGGNYTFTFDRDSGISTVIDFGGLGNGGKGSPPIPGVAEENDILKFEGEGLTAANLLLDQQGDDLHVSFEDIDDVNVILQNFDQNDLETHEYIVDGQPALGNIMFDGQEEMANTIDVISSNRHDITTVLHPNVATFHTDGDNDIQGFDAKASFDGISNDVINAQDGDDIIRGLAGDDILRGGNGNDTLIGGFGNDKLTGGAGADIFHFNAFSGGMDTIKDFESGESDRIILSTNNFSSDLVVGVLNESQFSLGSTAVRGSDRIIYNNTTGQLFFDADGTGATAQVQIAQLNGGPTLNHTDVLVVV